MAKVKCAYCGKQLNQKDAYAVKHGKRNKYYCSKEHSMKKTPKELFYDELLKILPSTNTIIYKEMLEISKVHGYEKMLTYLQENEDYLINIMNTKNFYNDYGKCKYIIAVLRNQLGDFQLKQPAHVIKKEVNFDMDMTVNNYKRKEQRKGMDDILADLMEDE